jgi:cell wall-associated NlpC family hydrolase
VTKLLTPQAFAARAVGIPWVKWRSDWSGCDCFGLLVLWHREVLGVDLGAVPETDIATGFAQASGWVECGGPEAGATCFMSWRDGAPGHCGVLLSPSEVLHAEGNDRTPRSVRVSTLRAVATVYGAMRFYRYQGAVC